MFRAALQERWMSTSSAALSCRAKRSIPCGVTVVRASGLPAASYRHELVRGIPHCVRNDNSFVEGFLTAFGMTAVLLRDSSLRSE